MLIKNIRTGVNIVTLADGDITHLHIGFKGTINALFLKNLTEKTHRGCGGRVKSGKVGSGPCFGCKAVRSMVGNLAAVLTDATRLRGRASHDARYGASAPESGAKTQRGRPPPHAEDPACYSQTTSIAESWLGGRCNQRYLQLWSGAA